MAHFTVPPQSSQIASKSECSGQRLRLIDLLIECSPESSSIARQEELELKLLQNDHNPRNSRTLNKTSSTTWKCQASLEIYLTSDPVELEIYAGGSDQRLGFITLISSQLEGHSQNISHAIKTASISSIGERNQILTLSFHVAKAEDTQDELEDPLVLTESMCQSLGSDSDKLILIRRAGDAFQSRFSRTNSLTDIDNAINTYEAANSLTLKDQKDKIDVIKILVQFYSARFPKTGDSDDIDKAIFFQRQILLLLPHDEEANRGRILHSLGGLLMCRSRYTNDEADIDETIITLKKAQDLTPIADSLLPFILRNLGSSFQIRYQKLKNMDDITHSIDVLRTATGLLPEDHPDFPYFLSNLGATLISRFLVQGNLSDIDESLSIVQKAADMLAVDHPDRLIMLSNLASSFVYRFRKTKDVVDIDNEISLRRQAITLMHIGHVDMPSILCNIGNAYLRRFEQTGALLDIDEAINIHRNGVQLFPANHVELVGKLFNHRNLLLRRLRRTHQSEDLEEVIAILERAASLTSMHHSYISDQLQTFRALRGELHTLAKYDDEIREKKLRLDTMLAGDGEIPTIRNELGLLYFLSFCLTGELEDIEASKDNLKSCVNLTLADDAALPTHHDELGSISLRKFRFTGDEVDIEDAFFSREQSIYFTPKNDEKLCERVDRLVYLLLLSLDTAPSSMRLAITARWKALDEYIASLSAENASVLSERLGRSLLLRFQRLDDMKDANRAIAMYNKALYYNVTPIRLAKLGEAYFRRFQRTGAVSDIENAIATQQRAVDQVTEDDPFMPRILNTLGISFLHLFKLKGNRLDLHEAIRLQRKAVDLDRSDHLLLSSLGSSLLRLAELSGNLRDLDESISLQQEAVRNVELGDEISVAASMNNLGNSFFTRYRLTQENIDIDEAILAYSKSMELYPDGHLEKPNTMDNLASSFYYRFLGGGGRDDLDRSISIRQNVLELTPANHLVVPALQYHLGSSLLDRYPAEKNAEDVNHAIRAFTACISAYGKLTENYLMKYLALAGLGYALLLRFCDSDKTDTTDINDAIKALQKVLDSIPDKHIDYKTYQIRLGMVFEQKFRHAKDGNSESFKSAVSLYQSAATSISGRVSEKMIAARRRAQLCRESTADPEASLNAYQIAIELFPQIAWLGQTIDQRYTNLINTSSLPSEAAAATLAVGRPDLALEWLEQGRSIVWNQLNQLQTAAKSLQVVKPELAEQLQKISMELEKAGNRVHDSNEVDDIVHKITTQQDIQKHHELAELWNATLCKIREVDGFEKFLLPTKSSVILKSLPKSSTVILINVHVSRCDAIALVAGTENPIHIPLENLTIDKVILWKRQLDAMISSIGTRYGRPFVKSNQPSIREILSNLWLSIVQPIINILQYPVTSDPTRIWWCTTGPLAFLPLHAAGIYNTKDPSPGAMVSDYIVSSYTPTVTAIIRYARNDYNPIFPTSDGILVVSQPATPNLPEITNTITECNIIVQKCIEHSLKVKHLEGENATIESVLQGMSQFNWIHLACHASQDVVKATQSAFYLHNGPLSLSSIIQHPLPKATFAFLSACETGTGDKNLAEESVHLAAGMLSAGYCSVVATMWVINDRHAPVIAEQFYSHMLSGRNAPGRSPSYALHYAAKYLRETLEDSELSFLIWVPFIHMGF